MRRANLKDKAKKLLDQKKTKSCLGLTEAAHNEHSNALTQKAAGAGSNLDYFSNIGEQDNARRNSMFNDCRPSGPQSISQSSSASGTKFSMQSINYEQFQDRNNSFRDSLDQDSSHAYESEQNSS